MFILHWSADDGANHIHRSLMTCSVPFESYSTVGLMRLEYQRPGKEHRAAPPRLGWQFGSLPANQIVPFTPIAIEFDLNQQHQSFARARGLPFLELSLLNLACDQIADPNRSVSSYSAVEGVFAASGLSSDLRGGESFDILACPSP